MTQITGKIYQMTNGKTGTDLENRFPRTVMEAVLGLNSYLQDQFSALADIYMPIEGISEAFTGQGFVYRKSPNTIKAKSLTLDRIRGKSLVWNQLISKRSDSASYSSGTLYIEFPFSAVKGHKYYFSADVSYVGSSCVYGFSAGQQYISGEGVAISTTKRTRGIMSNTYDNVIKINIRILNPVSGDSISANNVYLVDLTLLYGTEIDGLTDDEILAKYEADFGTGYHEYNKGTLISNDAESIETVGVNQRVSEPQNIEAGSFPPFNKNTYTRVFGGVPYYFRHDALGVTNWRHYYKAYDLGGNEITKNLFTIVSGGPYYNPYSQAWVDAADNANAAFPITFADDCYVYFGYGSGAVTAITQMPNICINFSDESINGQYFPYWKRTLKLGLNNLKVKSHNIWDEEYANGAWQANKNSYYAQNYVRSKSIMKALPGATLYFNSPTNIQIIVWDANGNALVNGGIGKNIIFSFPVNAYEWAFFTNYGSSTYNHDICINLSSSFNGQYEPYGDITINGLKSAGSVYDEIVGNKYIKRIGEVDLGTDISRYYQITNTNTYYTSGWPTGLSIKRGSNNLICSHYATGKIAGRIDKTINIYGRVDADVQVTDSAFAGYDEAQIKASLEGVKLCYELATPIEYDLVEPLIYTTKAGTTEERISPNSDGLSAPFCCDMTYSANDNNDAGNAQYAATAGRLLNTHKIWGQDFNGSEDVNGNLVSNGILQGTQLKSTVQTGTAPLVVSSTTTVANLVAEKASKLLTARTIWGQSFDGSGNISGAISNITTISASELATLAGGIALGTSNTARAARMVWSEDNNAWHLMGNLYADGFITARGLNDGSAASGITGQRNEKTGETFANTVGLYDAPNDEYFTVPSADSAALLTPSNILATRQWVIDNFEPKTV